MLPENVLEREMFEKLKGMFSSGILGRYRVEATVHRHPFYTIESARDRKSMRSVFLKTYTPEGADIQAKFDRLYRTRPLAEILPEIKHPSIVQTIEAEHSDARKVEVLEAVPSPLLRARIDARQMTPEEFRQTVLDIGQGLSYLHSKGLLHRGLAPEGIAVGPGGVARIMDLSLMMDASRASAGGTVVGPVGYTAPEVIARRGIDATCDVYSLGAIIYEMLTGTRLFPNARGYEGLLRMMNSKPEPLSERNNCVCPELEAVVMKAVERNPMSRYSTIDEMLAAFASAPSPERVAARAPAYAA